MQCLLCATSVNPPTTKLMPVPFPGHVKFHQLRLMTRILGLTEPNDDATANRTDDDMSNVSDEDDYDILHESRIDDEDVFLAELRSKPVNDDVSVANPGIFSTNDDSPTNNVLTDPVDPQPVEDSPNLFSVDEMNDGTVHLQPPTRSPGRKPAKIPLRTPTQPTLVTGKTAEKRDNAELSGPSDTETSRRKTGLIRDVRNVNKFFIVFMYPFCLLNP